MTTVSASEWLPAAVAFDALAPTYDAAFTSSLIGRAQRDRVWRFARRIFRAGAHILELNCGTGEDALFFARNGISVTACDASSRMVAVARHRISTEATGSPVRIHHLPTECLATLQEDTPFDAAFSNFSGLNCVQDLRPVAAQLARCVRPGGSLLLCLSTRICLTEILYYLLRGNPRKAIRRLSGKTEASLSGRDLMVYYPTLTQLRRIFAPHFHLVQVRGIGVAIPPSYMEQHIQNKPRLFTALCRLEPALSPLPLLRTTADHMLLHLRRRLP